MARTASGEGQREWARELLARAKTAEALRQAQAILLPLELGLSLEQTALAIGRSVSATCKLRNRPRREAAGELTPKKRKRELRNRAAANLERESAILDEVLTGSAQGGVIVIPALKPAYEKALGRPVALSTLYRVLARHGFRKLAPDTAHPKGDPLKGARTGEKTPQRVGEDHSDLAERQTVARDVSG